MQNSFNSKLESRRSILSRKFTWQYDANIKLIDGSLLSLLDKLSSSLKMLLTAGSTIKNVKGRDKLNVISENVELPFEQELLECNLSWKATEFGFEAESSEFEKTCSFHLLSSFDHFAAKDIFHRIEKVTIGETPSDLDLNQILSDSRLGINSFRIGIDTFGNNSFASWFISTPAVLETILIEADSSNLSLRIQSEEHKSVKEGLYDYEQIISGLLKSIQEIFNVDLLQDLKEKFK